MKEFPVELQGNCWRNSRRIYKGIPGGTPVAFLEEHLAGFLMEFLEQLTEIFLKKLRIISERNSGGILEGTMKEHPVALQRNSPNGIPDRAPNVFSVAFRRNYRRSSGVFSERTPEKFLVELHKYFRRVAGGTPKKCIEEFLEVVWKELWRISQRNSAVFPRGSPKKFPEKLLNNSWRM